MLSARALDYLTPLTYRPNAERRSCVIPLGGIYWADEIPDFNALIKVPESDRNLIYRLFSIRFKIWGGEVLSNSDRRYWDEARSMVPDYPLFRRLQLSLDDQRAQEEVERDALEGFSTLFAEADAVMVTEHEHGVKSFSMTFDLTKDNDQPAKWRPWWKRLWPWN
jgi:hypothetical protein